MNNNIEPVKLDAVIQCYRRRIREQVVSALVDPVDRDPLMLGAQLLDGST